MSELEELEDTIYNENIDMIDFPLQKTKGKIVFFEDKYFIVLNNKNIDSSIEKREILAEELGHYYTNAIYSPRADDVQKRKCEMRAIEWSFKKLVPLEELKEKIKEGYDLFELADFFNVSAEYMKNCIDFYTIKCKI